MQSRSTLYVFALALLFPMALVAGPLAAGQEVFEVMDPGALALGVCQTAHRIIDCSTYHIEGGTLAPEGTILELDGRKYLVEWTGPGYYLESGIVLQPLGETKAGLRGQRWLEVYPEQGKIHISRAWQDQDGNRVLSVSDTLALGGRKTARPLKVQDVRLQFRASPLAEEAEKP